MKINRMFVFISMMTCNLFAQSVKVSCTVKVLKNRIYYKYIISNYTDYPIRAFDIGLNGNKDEMELKGLPIGWSYSKPSQGLKKPKSWKGEVQVQEENDFHAISFEASRSASFVPPGGHQNSFEVEVKTLDLMYEHGHATIYFVGRPKETITIQKASE